MTISGAVALSGNKKVTVTANSLTLSGLVSGAYNLVKDGAGTLALSNAANTYSGTTTINAGTLSASAGSLAGTSDITVNGATLTANNLKALANLTVDSTGSATISGTAGQSVGTLTNNNTTASAVNFSGASGTVTVATLTGAGNTKFNSDATITNGISNGTVAVTGALNLSLIHISEPTRPY